MDETILFPSPNWFQASALVVSRDNWLVYGGPTKSLCVLEPLPEDANRVVQGSQGYHAHVVNRSHPEKIVCIDLSPEWPEKKALLTGSQDGLVKQWVLERAGTTMAIRSTHSHEIHCHEKEEVVGVGYCNDGYAITVGSYGHIVKWDLNSNVVKSYNKAVKGFRPTCIACSPHINLNVAIGTKQGVVFVLDLNGAARVLYKVRGQDDEVTKVGWCPQFEVAVRKMLKESNKDSNKDPPISAAAQRLEAIRQQPEHPDILKALDKRVQESATEEKPVLVNNNLEPVATASKDGTEGEDKSLNKSGIIKNLPEDSFDETIVQEDDTFDIYKDHNADEFGHKKYEPEDILVKVTEEVKQDDYLTECQKLKEEILKRKNQSEQSISALVDAMDSTHVDSPEPSTSQAQAAEVSVPVLQATASQGRITKGEVESSVHIHKHVLATIGKHGSVRLWSKSGKLVGSCMVQGSGNKNQRNQRHQSHTNWTTLLWYQPELLLLADGRSQLLECNPLKIDCKNKLEWKVVHSLHKRGLFSIASNAPRVQPPDMSTDRSRDTWRVWTTSQDRSLICYSMKQRAVVSEHHTCGGYLYTVQACPYDARKIAVSVGDGAVRVWEADVAGEDDTRLTPGHVASYWQNVQGKVLTVAWHPTREGLLAFATAESRVGLIDTGKAKSEKAARALQPSLSGGVYSLCWGEGGDLYACGTCGDLVRYNCDTPEDAPSAVSVSHEGQKWQLSAVQWTPRGMLCGSSGGGVAVVAAAPPHDVTAAAFVFSKIIHNIDWHPQETSNSDGESPYKNVLAVCSLDKCNNIVLLEYGDKDDVGKQLNVWKTLSGHTAPVLEVRWSPHVDGLLLSTSQDTTVRVWSVAGGGEGACVAVFGGHSQSSLGAAWSPLPQLSAAVLSGGGDCCLRLWNYTDYPPDAYEELKYEVVVKKDRKKNKKDEKKKTEAEDEDETVDAEDQKSAHLEAKIKASKKFLLPLSNKQMSPCGVAAVRWIFSLYCMQCANAQPPTPAPACDVDFIKMFGTTKELCELLDDELERLQDTGSVESWMMLNIVRGHMDAVFAYAAEKDLLDPYLLSVAPCVSFKYWKDITLLYLAQIDRLMAKGQEAKLYETKMYGGPIYRKVGTLLSLHDVNGAVKVLVEAQLFKEAYVLCRTRYAEELAKTTLQQWAYFCDTNGNYNLSAICYIALGDVIKAATVLGKSSNEQALYTAGAMAHDMGQSAFSKHCFDKCKQMEKAAPELESEAPEAPEVLEPLPSRTELLLKGEEMSKESAEAKDHDLEQPVEASAGAKPEEQVSAKVEDKVGPEDKMTKVEGLVVTERGDSNVAKPEENAKEAADEDKTEEMLEDLPSKMEGLMKVANSGDGEKNGVEQIVQMNGAGDAQANGTSDVVK